jgi:hypothetical protein
MAELRNLWKKKQENTEKIKTITVNGHKSFFKTFNKKKNSQLFQVESVDTSDTPYLLTLTNQEIGSPISLSESVEYAGILSFPNLYETFLSSLRVIPIITTESGFTIPSSSIEGFQTSDTLDYDVLFDFQEYWRKTLDQNKGYIYQFYFKATVPQIDSQTVPLYLYLKFQAQNSRVFHEIINYSD